jgi:predicted dehydrogenase
METKTDRVKFAEVDETMVWQAQFPGGVLAECATSYNSAPYGRVFAAAQHGWFELEPAFNYSGIRGRRSDGREIAFPQVDQFATELDAFARSILDDAPFRASGEEGMRDVRIMSAIYEAARTGRRVAL